MASKITNATDGYVYDVTEQFKSYLDELKIKHTQLQIHYFYPNKFTDKACVSYKLAGNPIMEKTINNKPRRQEASFTVDFWGKSPAELSALATELKGILSKYGYYCSLEQDLKDPSEIYYHKTTRFSMNFDNKLKITL